MLLAGDANTCNRERENGMGEGVVLSMKSHAYAMLSHFEESLVGEGGPIEWQQINI